MAHAPRPTAEVVAALQGIGQVLHQIAAELAALRVSLENRDPLDARK
jgi:hypothetical protein